MAVLRVKNFSCIDTAELTVSQMTILIGPQASGKSVLSKLVYFFYNIVLSSQFNAIEEGQAYSEFVAGIGEEFKKWFPPSAWGSSRFRLEFSAGPYTASILRRLSRGEASDHVRVKFSEYFEREYEGLLESMPKRRESNSESFRDEFDPRKQMELIWRIRSTARRKLSSEMGSEYSDYQTFIPAGRSFFTSIGKAVAAFEQGGMLDPVTIRFGRLFASVKEYSTSRAYSHQSEDERLLRNALTRQLFGGEIRIERDKEFVESYDGRRIPFSALSSGQQELLPLWLTLESSIRDRDDSGLMYIEEPEAHLFPSAQNLLVEYLAGLVSGQNNRRRMIVTTHSPYVLSKLNNLLKAGSVGARRTKSAKVANVLPKEAWLRPNSTAAYAIVDRGLVSLIGDDGLIDGDYLDQVSGDIGREFNELLEIQYS